METKGNVKMKIDDSLHSEIIALDSYHEDEDALIDTKKKSYFLKNHTENSEKNNSAESNSAKHLLRIQKTLRGLLSSTAGSCEVGALERHPVVKRCCIEHCYFATKVCDEKGTDSNEGEKRSQSTNASDTLPFSNETPSRELTIDGEPPRTTETCEVAESATQNKSLEKSSARKKWNWTRSKENHHSETDESELDQKNDRDYFEEENLTGSERSDESESDAVLCRLKTNDGAGRGLAESRKREIERVFRKRVQVLKNVSSRLHEKQKFIVFKRLGEVGEAKTVPNNFISVQDFLAKIKKMHKFVNSKMGDPTMPTNRDKIPPPKLKRIPGIARPRFRNTNRISNAFLSVPNLTKITSATANKNWKVRYMDNEVQTLGLDDLLLKASELNAENFTKALARKLEAVRPTFKSQQTSEVLLTIPQSKKPSTDAKQNTVSDSPKVLKTLQMDFLPNSSSSSTKEKNPDSGAPVSPRKTGIKVKTVENINEEFQGSLDLNKNDLQDSLPEKESPIDNDKDFINLNSASSGVGHRRGENPKPPQNDSLSRELPQDDTRPFIMTIVHGKTDKQRPAILRNSTFFKKKLHPSPDASKPQTPKPDDNDKPSSDSPKSDLKDPLFPEDHHAKPLETNKLPSNSKEDDLPQDHTKSLQSNKGPDNPDQPKSNLPTKPKNLPLLANHNKKTKPNECDRINPPLKSSTPLSGNLKLVKAHGQGTEKTAQNDKVFRVTSIEQKIPPKDDSKKSSSSVKVIAPTESDPKGTPSGDRRSKTSEEGNRDKNSKDPKSGHVLSLSAFTAMLKEILPDKWFLSLDKKYGLQIIKTHVDEVLNPSVLMSVVVARCGKVTVNVRGKQLDNQHQLFSNLCNLRNSDNQLSLNYILAILNKLRYLGVCYGCDPGLIKYTQGDNSATVEGNLGHRSPLCPLLVSVGKKRCYPCYRMNESLKKRHRRDKAEEKAKEADGEEETTGKESSQGNRSPKVEPETETSTGGRSAPARGVKRNLEYFLEESFSTMKQQIEDELEKNKKFGEMEKALKAQEEVLSFMGLTRKDNLDGNPVRKSKRTRSSFQKSQQQQQQQQPSSGTNRIDQKELEFLETYWTDINTLFSTSLLFGAYSRTGRSRLREKCRMFHKLLSTWREIVKTNPEWIGGEIVTIPGENSRDPATADHFDKMDVTALRSYIINSVKEVNRIKHKLRTRNSYFKLLYNKFVKRRMKRAKSGPGSGERTEEDEEKKETGQSSANSTATTTPTDFSSDESAKEKDKPENKAEQAGKENDQLKDVVTDKVANDGGDDTAVTERNPIVPVTTNLNTLIPTDSGPSPSSLTQD